MAKKALEGVKVADFTWVGVGPFTVNYLAQCGATVVRVESKKNPDMLRTSPAFKDRITDPDYSAYWAQLNPNKYGITPDLRHPKGLEVAKRLIAWADIVAESFLGGVMERLGLGYEDIKKIKPDIIMYRATNQGQTGPYASLAGLGTQLAGLAGFQHLAGWPDRIPSTAYFAYTDQLSPHVGALAVMAALDYRRRTGKGQCLDLSQIEASLNYLAPVLMDWTVNGREQCRDGNRCPYAAPHGAYRCLGEERWCVIAIFTDEEWKAFCHVMDDPQWTTDPRFTTLLGRKANEDELNRLVEEWTSKRSPEEITVLLQNAGVAAGVVKNVKDVYEDPQLRERKHLWQLNHREIGPLYHWTMSPILSKTPIELTMPAPCLGEHNEYVCTQILGMSDEEFFQLLAEKVFFD